MENRLVVADLMNATRENGQYVRRNGSVKRKGMKVLLNHVEEFNGREGATYYRIDERATDELHALKAGKRDAKMLNLLGGMHGDESEKVVTPRKAAKKPAGKKPAARKTKRPE